MESTAAEIGVTLPCLCGMSRIKYLDPAALEMDPTPGCMHVSGAFSFDQ